MLKNPRQIVPFVAIVIVICFAAVLLFTMPSFLEQFNLSLTSKANIGNTVGGITAPIVGLISSILLYMALTKQTEANEQQRIKNESDMVFLLINQMDAELNSFYSKQTQGNKDIKVNGLEGFNDFTRNYRYVDNIAGLIDITFKNYYESGQIVLMIDTFNLIDKRIDLSNLSNEMKKLFEAKLDSYYECKLKTPLTSLSEAFDMYKHHQDDYTKKVQEFVKKHN